MSDQDNNTKVAFWLVGAAAAAAIGMTLYVGGKAKPKLALPPVQASEAAAVAASAASAAADQAVRQGSVVFDSAQAVLSDKDKADIVAAAKKVDGATLVLSGFHDASGSAELNAKLAKERAMAVRDALVAQGVPADHIRLQKPQEMLGGTDPAQARRVDISLVH